MTGTKRALLCVDGYHSAVGFYSAIIAPLPNVELDSRKPGCVADAVERTEQVTLMESLRTIKTIKPVSGTTLRVRWATGSVVNLDLHDLLKKPAFKSLRGGNFQKVQVSEWGHSIAWPGGVELGADELWRRTLKAAGRVDALEFLDWRVRHGLSLSAAAESLGLSRRMVAYYSSGSKVVPRTVLLACAGWEHTAAAA